MEAASTILFAFGPPVDAEERAKWSSYEAARGAGTSGMERPDDEMLALRKFFLGGALDPIWSRLFGTATRLRNVSVSLGLVRGAWVAAVEIDRRDFSHAAPPVRGLPRSREIVDLLGEALCDVTGREWVLCSMF